MVSSPADAMTTSFPCLPVLSSVNTLSLPAPGSIRSFPEPAQILSLPPAPKILSLPPSETMTSALGDPRKVLLLALPTIVAREPRQVSADVPLFDTPGAHMTPTTTSATTTARAEKRKRPTRHTVTAVSENGNYPDARLNASLPFRGVRPVRQPNCCQVVDSSLRVPPVSGQPALSAP